jgi:hypothetical protein
MKNNLKSLHIEVGKNGFILQIDRKLEDRQYEIYAFRTVLESRLRELLKNLHEEES